MDKPPRTAPYVAPGAPRSPLVLAIAGAITTALAMLARVFDFELLNVNPDDVLAIVAGIAVVVGVVQDRGARAEQVRGVAELEAARAELPPGAVAADPKAGTQ